MRNWLAAVVIAGGCAFTPGMQDQPGGSGQRGGGGPGSGSGMAPSPTCERADPSGLELCLDFNSATTLGTDSGPDHNDATVANVVPMTRAQEAAAQFNESSQTHVAESPSIDVTTDGAFSIEAWIDLAQLPAPDDSYQVVSHPQYSIEVHHDGGVRCTIGTYYADSDDTGLDGIQLATGTWTHVGCTYDPTTTTVAVYFDGSPAHCYQLDSDEQWNADAPGTSGVTVGEPFVGGIDNVHVLARTIGAAEMCELAGQTGCKPVCPDD
ncbi:MAG TPA: LamG-like jellyroll fold domain-containing protein [Kofleriaceae bacterium]|nr:LamG-like jellyroll fold domain-containing protein [Kofleriaceae bacterium]